MSDGMNWEAIRNHLEEEMQVPWSETGLGFIVRSSELSGGTLAEISACGGSLQTRNYGFMIVPDERMAREDERVRRHEVDDL